MIERNYQSNTIPFLYALGLATWLIWIIRLPDAFREPGVLRWLFPALGLLITTFLAIVHCLDRDARRRAGLPIEPIY
jgi:hypothetical protein